MIRLEKADLSRKEERARTVERRLAASFEDFPKKSSMTGVRPCNTCQIIRFHHKSLLLSSSRFDQMAAKITPITIRASSIETYARQKFSSFGKVEIHSVEPNILLMIMASHTKSVPHHWEIVKIQALHLIYNNPLKISFEPSLPAP